MVGESVLFSKNRSECGGGKRIGGIEENVCRGDENGRAGGDAGITVAGCVGGVDMRTVVLFWEWDTVAKAAKEQVFGGDGEREGGGNTSLEFCPLVS